MPPRPAASTREPTGESARASTRGPGAVHPSPRPFAQGARDIAPVLLGVVPFGLVTGISAVAAGIPAAEAIAMSAVVFAGASQLAGIQLIAVGGAPWLIWLTTLMINLRMLVYSADLAPRLRGVPPLQRLGMAHLLTDQAYAFSAIRYRHGGEEERAPLADPLERRDYYLGTAVPIFPVWLLATAAGALLGARIPPAWGVEFIIPLIFLAILVPTLRDRPSWLAAVVGGGLALLLRDVPANGGLMLGALAGIAAGAVAERLLGGGSDGGDGATGDSEGAGTDGEGAATQARDDRRDRAGAQPSGAQP